MKQTKPAQREVIPVRPAKSRVYRKSGALTVQMFPFIREALNVRARQQQKDAGELMRDAINLLRSHDPLFDEICNEQEALALSREADALNPVTIPATVEPVK